MTISGGGESKFGKVLVSQDVRAGGNCTVGGNVTVGGNAIFNGDVNCKRNTYNIKFN